MHPFTPLQTFTDNTTPKIDADFLNQLQSGGVNAVAIHGDTAILGAPVLDPSGIQNAGVAFVFVRAAGVWSQQAELVAADGAANDAFGGGVAVNGDTAIVGSPFKDVAGNADQGVAYVFVRSGGAWSLQAEITAPDVVELPFPPMVSSPVRAVVAVWPVLVRDGGRNSYPVMATSVRPLAFSSG